MPAILRNVTRTVLDSAETTAYTKSPSQDALTFELTASSEFYICFKKPFSTRHFNFDTANTVTGVVITVEYWDGTDWAEVLDIVDQTWGFTRSGFLSWVNDGKWQPRKASPIDDVELYWAKITVDQDLSAGTSLQSVLNLFCDEDMLQAYYPELVTDTRYLPEGRSDFIEQLHAAKEWVVHRLKKDHLIKDENQIEDINEVAIAATHATAWVILNPIAKDDGDKEKRDEAFNDANRELNRVKIDIDWDESGVIEDDEKDIGNIFIPRL